MYYYKELTLLSSADISHHFLWEKVMKQIHLGLVELKENGRNSIGLSMPGYGYNEQLKKLILGNRIRFFAEHEQTFTLFNFDKWFNRLSDYVNITDTRIVPKVHQFAIFKRIRNDHNIEALARRRSKRLKISFNEALIHFSKYQVKHIDLPFIHIKSESTQQKFPLIIEKRCVATEIVGSFSTYGLSHVTTVPDF